MIIYQFYQAKTITLNTIQAKPLKYNSCATEIRASAPASNAEDTITKYELPQKIASPLELQTINPALTISSTTFPTTF